MTTIDQNINDSINDIAEDVAQETIIRAINENVKKSIDDTTSKYIVYAECIIYVITFTFLIGIDWKLAIALLLLSNLKIIYYVSKRYYDINLLSMETFLTSYEKGKIKLIAVFTILNLVCNLVGFGLVLWYSWQVAVAIFLIDIIHSIDAYKNSLK